MGRKKKKYNPKEIIEGFRVHDKKVLELIYTRYFTMVRDYVVARTGSDDDAWDVFQEAMGVVYDLAMSERPRLVITSSFKTFFFGICSNIWYKMYRFRQTETIDDSAQIEVLGEDQSEYDQLIESNMLFMIYQRQLENLEPECVKLLELVAKNKDGNTMAKKLKISSAQAVYNKKRQCIRKLIDLIQNDPEYKKLTDYETPRKN